MVKEKWNKCTEGGYPDINNRLILVRYKDSIDNCFYYYIYSECPYGWNVLIRRNAEYMILEEF